MQIKLGSNLAKELERQKSLAIEAQEEVKKSLQYSSRIQGAMLPSSLPENLTVAKIWKPLSVVGGDFYVIKDLGETIMIAVIDCTGHGVPGALLSLSLMKLNTLRHQSLALLFLHAKNLFYFEYPAFFEAKLCFSA